MTCCPGGGEQAWLSLAAAVLPALLRLRPLQPGRCSRQAGRHNNQEGERRRTELHMAGPGMRWPPSASVGPGMRWPILLWCLPGGCRAIVARPLYESDGEDAGGEALLSQSQLHAADEFSPAYGGEGTLTVFSCLHLLSPASTMPVSLAAAVLSSSTCILTAMCKACHSGRARQCTSLEQALLPLTAPRCSACGA